MTRTYDLVVNSHPLYQLSYRGMCSKKLQHSGVSVNITPGKTSVQEGVEYGPFCWRVGSGSDYRDCRTACGAQPVFYSDDSNKIPVPAHE
jgi:hypothetical protein